MNPTDPVSREAYQLALSQIAMLQTYLGVLGGVISALGIFFGVKWISGITETVRTNTELTISNKDMAAALNGLIQVVTAHGKN